MDMDPIINGGIAFAAVLILMVLNIPIGIAMLLVGFTGFALISGFDPAIFVLGTAPFDAVSKYTLSVLPLFVLMGNLANSANLSRNLYDAAYAVVGHYKGGLAMSTVGACAGFGMICGSSIATAATMSQMAGPEMKRHGYSDALISGSIASGGTLRNYYSTKCHFSNLCIFNRTICSRTFLCSINTRIDSCGFIYDCNKSLSYNLSFPWWSWK